jgi:hypothetical protein
MKTCEFCKYWDDSDKKNLNKNYGHCNYYEISKIIFKYKLPTDPIGNMIKIDDPYVGCEFNKNFGCIFFEEK